MGSLDAWLPPLTDYTLRCDCGHSYYHAIHLDELIRDCFADNPQDHLCPHDLCPEELEDAPEGHETTLFFVLKIAIKNVIHKNATSMILICLCRLQSPQCGVPRRYRWYSAGGQNCPAARGATMLIIQHGG